MYALECDQFDEIMSWSGDGRSFAINDKDGFEYRVLPALFKPSKFESFIRKLCRWGFAKRRASGRYGQEETALCVWFYHPNFQKGNFELCSRVECRQNTKMGGLKSISSTSNHSIAHSSSARVDVSTIGSMIHRNNANNLVSSNPSSLSQTSASSQATSSNLGHQSSLSSLRQSSGALPTKLTIESLAASLGMQGQWLSSSHSDSSTGRGTQYQDQGMAVSMHGLGGQNSSRGGSPSLSDLIEQNRYPELESNRNSTNTALSFGDSSQHSPSQRVPPGRMTSAISEISSSSDIPSDDHVQDEIGQLQVDCSNLSRLCDVYKLSKTQHGNSVMPSCASTSSSGDGSGQQNSPNKTQWNANGNSFAPQKNDLAGLNGACVSTGSSGGGSGQQNSPNKTQWNANGGHSFAQKNDLAGQPLPSLVKTKPPTIRVGGDRSNSKEEIARLIADISNLTQMCELLRQNQNRNQNQNQPQPDETGIGSSMMFELLRQNQNQNLPQQDKIGIGSSMFELLRQNQNQPQQDETGIGSSLNKNVMSQNLAMSQDQKQLEDGVSSYGVSSYGCDFFSAFGSLHQSGSGSGSGSEDDAQF